MSDAPHDPNISPDRTTDEAEAPAVEEPENPWAFLESPPKDEPERDDDVLRLKDVSKSWLAGYILKKGCLTLLIIFVALIACDMFLTSSKYNREARLVHANAMRCSTRLKEISESLDCLIYPDRMPDSLREEVEPVEITPDMTVADLIREAVRQGILSEGRNGKYLCCPRSGEPYLVFSERASVLLQKPEPHKHIPIVIDPPNAHDESRLTMFICRLFHMHSTDYAFTARVLYANGTIGTLTREEAEKLVAERSPMPITFVLEPETEEKPE